MPGVKINLSKSGASATVGGQGVSANYKLAAGPKTNWTKVAVWVNVIGWSVVALIAGIIYVTSDHSTAWKNPVTVKGQGINIRDGAGLMGTKVVAQVSTGDTLELVSLNFPSQGWAGIERGKSRGSFPGAINTGYVQQKFITIPDSILKKAKGSSFIR